jgi:GntR family transcriptional repressor for pyruvate dehydrogenase complex
VSQPTSPSEDRPPSLVERISADLRADILSGRYRAGDRLPSERELAVRFETHRGTVREALKKLEQLGLAEIRPGGARAAPIEEASLDVVRHLMDLGPTPDPEVFDQIFEVFGALFSLSARLMVERGDETEHAHAQAILERLITEPLSTVEEFGLVQDLSAAFANASRNLVLKLVRKGLHTEVMAQIDHPETLFRPPKTRRDALLRALRDALAARDGAAASDAVFMLNRAVRENAVALLQDERVRAESAEPSKARTTERTPPDVRHGAPKR